MLPSRLPRSFANRPAVRQRSVEFTRRSRRFIGTIWRRNVRGLSAIRSETILPPEIVRFINTPSLEAFRAVMYHWPGFGSALSAETQTTPLR